MESRSITVLDKNRNLIAIFTNDSPCNSDEVALNTMVAPTINIVSNGESTLSFQMLKESPKWNDIKDPENIYQCNNREYTALNAHSVVYSGKIVSVTLVETWYLLEKKYVQAYNINPDDDPVDEHTVKILPKAKDQLFVNGKPYSDSDVKDSRGVVQPRGSAGYALWAILKDSGWSLGVCDVIDPEFDASKDWGTFNVESDMKDVLFNIQFVQQQYGGILVWDSKNKTVSLRSESIEDSDFNTWKGYSVRKGKNLQEEPLITWDNDLITRLYVLGQDNLNIKKVNDQKGYVEDYSYTTSIYEGYMQNQNIYGVDKSESDSDVGVDGQTALLYWGREQVKKYSRPRKSVSYNIIDIRGNSEAEFYEDFDINDIARAYYVDENTKQEVSEDLRIQHLQYNWFFPGSDSIVEVGDKIANEVEIFHTLYKNQRYDTVKRNALNEIATAVFVEVASEAVKITLSAIAKIAWNAIISWVAGGFPMPFSTVSTFSDTPSTMAISPTYKLDSMLDNIGQATDKLMQLSTQTSEEVSALNASTSLMQVNAEATDSDVADLLAYVNEKIGDLGTNEDGTPKTVKQYIDEKFAELSAK